MRGNDFDPDSPNGFDLVEIDNPAHGTASNNGIVVYTPDPGFTGVDTITYTIRDTHGLTATGLATVLVNTTGNQPRSPSRPSYSVQESQTLPITLSAVDPNGLPLTWTLSRLPPANCSDRSAAPRRS